MSDIYDLHDKAFQHVSAFVICKGGERVASIAIKYPRDGAGRMWAYVHWFGTPMVRGKTDGFGYDKRSAAVAHAASRMALPCDQAEEREATGEGYRAFVAAISTDGGEYWDTRLRNAGFDVFQAV